MEGFNGFDNQHPYRLTVHVSLGQHFIRLHGGLNSGLFPMLLDHEVGGSVDVYVGEHSYSVYKVGDKLQFIIIRIFSTLSYRSYQDAISTYRYQ